MIEKRPPQVADGGLAALPVQRPIRWPARLREPPQREYFAFHFARVPMPLPPVTDRLMAPGRSPRSISRGRPAMRESTALSMRASSTSMGVR